MQDALHSASESSCTGSSCRSAPPASHACPVWTSSGLARRLRIEKRQRLILHGESSPDPAVREAAQRLKDDMHAVELARLSDNSYAQYDPQAGPKQKKPPEPWAAMTEQQIGMQA